MKIEIRKLSELKNYENNARIHPEEQIKEIADSIKQFGFNDPIEISEDGTILSGHGRVAAAILLELDEVPVVIHAHLNDHQKKAYILAANRIQQSAKWDVEKLRIELLDLINFNSDLSLTGFTPQEIDTYLDLKIENDEDAEEELQNETKTKVGDIWVLDRHRLMCGDSTSIDDFTKLMAEDKADMIFTDPPYNVNFTEFRGEGTKIKNDCMKSEDFEKFLEDVFSACLIFSKKTLSAYIFHSDSTISSFRKSLDNSGFQVMCTMIWSKNRMCYSRAITRYKQKHEPILFVKIKDGKINWYGPNNETTIWEFEQNKSFKIHPTMKPVSLIERAIKNSSKIDDIILEPFSGSGSTLIACEKKARICRAIEIDPQYIDATVRRWQRYTGKKAILESTKEFFGE